MKKSVLVIGGTGLIGSEVVNTLLDSKKYNVFSFSHRRNENCTSFVGDVSILPEIEFVFQNYKIDTTLILFGNKSVANSVDTNLYTKNDFLGLVNILYCCDKYNCKKVVYLSSSAVYKSGYKLKEDSPLCHNTYYSFLKNTSESLLEWYRLSKKIEYVVLRCFNVVGFSKNRKTKDIISLLCENNKLTVFGNDFETTDGTIVRDYVWVSDVANAIEKSIDYPVSNIFNIGSGDGKSILDIIACYEKIFSLKPTISYSERRPFDQPILESDITKATKYLDWFPNYTLEDMIKIFYEKTYKGFVNGIGNGKYYDHYTGKKGNISSLTLATTVLDRNRYLDFSGK